MKTRSDHELLLVTQDPKHARRAVEQLVNHGVAAHRIYALCSEEAVREGFRSELPPPGGPVPRSAPRVVATMGAGIGVAIGAVSLAAFGVAPAVVGALLVGLMGAIAGWLAGRPMLADTLRTRLRDRYSEELRAGKILVAVAENAGDDGGPTVDQARSCLKTSAC